jgi:hypothetical protein
LIQIYQIQKLLRKCISLIPKKKAEIQNRIYKECVAALNVHPTTWFVAKKREVAVLKVSHIFQFSKWSSAHDYN